MIGSITVCDSTSMKCDVGTASAWNLHVRVFESDNHSTEFRSNTPLACSFESIDASMPEHGERMRCVSQWLRHLPELRRNREEWK